MNKHKLKKLLPEVTEIEIIKQTYNDYKLSSGDCSSFHLWTGLKCYRWLWFEWKRTIYEGKDFFVDGDKLTFSKTPKDEVSITITYTTTKYRYRKGISNKNKNEIII